MSDASWMDFAACRGQPSEMFFPDRGKHTLKAREICKTCPVIDVCREYATANKLEGVWGGMYFKANSSSINVRPVKTKSIKPKPRRFGYKIPIQDARPRRSQGGGPDS